MHHTTIIKLRYTSFLVIAYVLGIFAYFNLLGPMNLWAINCDGSCSAHQGIYRASFTGFIFFLIHMLLSLALPPAFNEASYYICRIIPFTVLYFVTFAIPGSNAFFDIWAYIAFGLSLVFLITQSVVQALALRTLGDNMSVTKALALLVVLNLLGLGVIIICTIFFASYSQCRAQQAVVATTILSVIIMYGIGLYLRISLLPIAGVFFYATLLLYGGLSAYTYNTSCVRYETSSTVEIIFGLALVLITIIALVFASTKGAQYVWLHAIFALSCGYMAMVLTSWAIVSTGTSDGVGTGYTSGIIRIVNVFVCFIISMVILAIVSRGQ